MNSYAGLLSKFITNPLGTLSLPAFQIYQLSFFVILVFLLIGLRISLSLIGRRYSSFRVFLGPLVLVVLVAYNYYNSYVVSLSLNIFDLLMVDIISVPFLVLLGMFVGHRLARKDRVFMKKGKPHYRSSVPISLIWALSFLIRMGIVTYLPLIQVSLGLISSAVLDITTGLILGEAIKIHGTYRREFSAGMSTSS